jgi:hypothetical protein
VNGAHRRADQGQVPLLRPLAIIAGLLAVLALSFYAFLCMFNTTERVAIGGCFGIAVAVCAAGTFLPEVTARNRKWFVPASILLCTASTVFTLLHHARPASVPAPGIFYPLVCVVVFAGVIAGLILGVSLHHES